MENITLEKAKQFLSDAKDLLSKHKFAGAPATPATPANEPATPVDAYKEYSLQDGNKVFIDKLEVGGTVVIKDTDNNNIPVQAGEYTLADNIIIQTDETGSIIELSSPTEDNIPEEMAKQVKCLETKLSEHEQKIVDLSAQLQSVITEKESQALAFSEQSKSAHDDIAILKTAIEAITSAFNEALSAPSEAAKGHSAPSVKKVDAFDKTLAKAMAIGDATKKQ